jgi:polyphosphate kinase
VGRFLEHSRIFYFANGGQPETEEIYIGSADWMLRNLDRRVEVVVPINDPVIKDYLRNTVLEAYLRDNVNAKTLKADGSYRPVDGTAEPFDSQMFFVGQEIPV